jgi:response regulator NasT
MNTIARADTAATTDSQPATILLADDDEFVLATMVRCLRAHGFGTIETTCGPDALAICESTPPSLAILDYDLPGLSGIELAKALTALQTIPFIFLSGHGEDDVVREAINAGAMAYLLKPTDPAKLIPVIRTAIQRFDDVQKLRTEKDRLAAALNSGRRVSVATGVLMERLRLREHDAFELLRSHARRTRRRLTDVAEELLGAADHMHRLITQIAETPAARPGPRDRPA